MRGGDKEKIKGGVERVPIQHNRTLGFAKDTSIWDGTSLQQQLDIQNYHFILNYTDTKFGY